MIEDCLEYLEDKRYFSILDLKNGFHRVKVSESSVKYTSFVTPMGQYEYVRMPFGLKNAPSVFQRFITKVLRPLIDDGSIIVYIDDILIATSDLKSHMKILARVLHLLSTYRLKLNLKKCQFCYTEIEYLGYLVDSQGIRPSERHTENIRGYPLPRSAREVQSCLGLFPHFRRFVPNFSRIAKPLLDLVRKDVPFRMTEECIRAFNGLRDKLAMAPVLAIYSPQRETELHCDASALGYGGVLMQPQDDGKLHPIAYFSKRTSEAESKLHSFVLETLAIIYSLRRFHVYLHGLKFCIVTDCNSLVMTLNKKDPNPQVARWIMELRAYNCEIVHRSGVNMGHALSRHHQVALIGR